MSSREARWMGTALAVLIVAVFAQSYQARARLIDSQWAGCERGKLDRRDNALGWTAHATYIESVLGARSVKRDVKDAAGVAQHTYRLISADLMRRSRIDCAKVFPRPSPLPF